jgi:16S rRNA (cytidine1402-2'-O)-methyltransferase
VLEVMGNRHLVVAREVTKVHEEFLRGRCADVLAQLQQKEEVVGEITLLIGRAEEEPHPLAEVPLRSRIEQLMREQGLDRMAALKIVAKERGISKRQAYRQYEQVEEAKAAPQK